MLENQTNATHHITEGDRVALERWYEQLVAIKDSNKEQEEIFDTDPIHNYKCVEILAFLGMLIIRAFSEQSVIQNQELESVWNSSKSIFVSQCCRALVHEVSSLENVSEDL